jgi:hypothetical protein
MLRRRWFSVRLKLDRLESARASRCAELSTCSRNSIYFCLGPAGLFVFDHLAIAAFRALALRCSGVSLAALFLPPFEPPILPNMGPSQEEALVRRKTVSIGLLRLALQMSLVGLIGNSQATEVGDTLTFYKFPVFVLVAVDCLTRLFICDSIQHVSYDCRQRNELLRTHSRDPSGSCASAGICHVVPRRDNRKGTARAPRGYHHHQRIPHSRPRSRLFGSLEFKFKSRLRKPSMPAPRYR